MITALAHVCFLVDDLDKTRKEFMEKGVKVSKPITGVDNTRQAWVEDPEGNKIELHEYNSDSLQRTWNQDQKDK